MVIKILKGLYLGGSTLAFIAFVAGIAGGYFRLFGPGPAFGLFALGMVSGSAFLVCGLVDLARNGTQPRSVLLIFMLIPAVALVYGFISGREYPMLNDVTTDLVNPPAFQRALTHPENEGRTMEFPVQFKDEVEEFYSDLEPLTLNRSIDEVHMEVMDAINNLPNWAIEATEVSPREIIIEGTVTSGVFGFVDDYAIRLASASGGCVVDMRSKSRLGKGDFGQNAAHIRALFDLIRL